MRGCRECQLVEGQFAVTLDEEAVCNYCRHWQAHRKQITNYTALEPLLIERIESLRGLGQYDALVGFSGGKDSTYVINSLRKKHGLRVLALTFDNGFLTNWARSSITQSVANLGIDHCFYRPDWDLHRAIYRAAFVAYGDPCVGCAIPVYFYTIKYAFENRIPMIVHGRSPFQIFRNFYPGSPDVFLDLHLSNYQHHSTETLTRIYRMFDGCAREWLSEMFPHDAALKTRVYDTLFPDPALLDGTFAPDFLGLFQYEPYDEEGIKRKLEQSVGFHRPTNDELLGHNDCAIHSACGHVFQRLWGTSAVAIEIAAMVRHGVLDAQSAMRLLHTKVAHERERPDEPLRLLQGAIGFNDGQFESTLEDLTRRVRRKFPCH